MDQNKKQTTKKYVYGYDLYSSFVRQYSSVTDLKTVKNAIIGNIHDYVEYLEAFDEYHSYDLRQGLTNAMIIIVVFLAAFLFWESEFLKGHRYLYLTLVFICCTLSPLTFYLDASQNFEGLAYYGIGSSLTGTENVKKDYSRAFKGRRIIIFVKEIPNSSKICIEAQIVGPQRIFTSAPVYHSVSREVPFGKYFTEDGFFFPPTLVADVDMLLRSLKSLLLKKKQ